MTGPKPTNFHRFSVKKYPLGVRGAKRPRLPARAKGTA